MSLTKPLIWQSVSGTWTDGVTDGVNRLANTGIFSSLGGISLATASATYVDVTGASLSWTKLGGASDTDVEFHLDVGYFATVANTGSKWGVHIGSTDYDVKIAYATLANTSVGSYSGWKRLTGIAAGSYTVQVRALRTSGTGNVSLDTNNSNVSFKIVEIPL